MGVSTAADSASPQEAQTDRQQCLLSQIADMLITMAKGQKCLFFHYETKYTVIFSPPNKESKEVSTARLVWAGCGSAMLHQHLPFHRAVGIEDLCLLLPPRAGASTPVLTTTPHVLFLHGLGCYNTKKFKTS